MLEFWALDNVCDITDSLSYLSQFLKGNVFSEVFEVDFVTLFNLVGFAEFLELWRSELGGIVTNQTIHNTKAGKQFM